MARLCSLATIALPALLLTGCVTTEKAVFTAQGPGQQSLVRDGRDAIASTQPNSLAIVGPAGREFQKGRRPVFVVALLNRSKGPLDFRAGDMRVLQVMPDGSEKELHVFSYEELVKEERRRQIATAIVVGLAAGANAAAASQAGHYRSSGTIHSRYGTSTVHVTGYSPALAAAAQSRADAQNHAMVGNLVAEGRQNLAALEQSVVKDNTLLVGEWYGGSFQFQPPEGEGSKTYRIEIRAGADMHVIQVTQAPNEKA